MVYQTYRWSQTSPQVLVQMVQAFATLLYLCIYISIDVYMHIYIYTICAIFAIQIYTYT